MTEAAADWVRPALAAGQDLGFDLQPAATQGEAWLLRELLSNLLHNAQQHAGRGAQVTVRTRTEGGQAVLEVEDDGPGIDPADRARAWDRFHRGSTASGPGTGLGLPIVQHIAQLHEGHAELLAGPAASGLCVRVRLPRAVR